MRPIVALVFSIALGSSTLHSQTSRTGLLVVAHGATPAWNAGVRATVAQVRWGRGPVEVAFLMGAEADSSGWNAGLRSLAARGATSIVVIPLMVSTFGDHTRQIEYYAGARTTLPAGLEAHDHRDASGAPVLPMRVTGALDAAPELGAILLDAWRLLPPVDQRRPVLLLAHGPQTDSDAARWDANLGAAGRVLAAGGMTGEFRIALVRDDAAPELRAKMIGVIRDTVSALAARARDSVVVIPVLVSTGSLDRVKMPGDLAGLPVAMRPAPLAPSPRLARWIERVAAAALSGEGGVQVGEVKGVPSSLPLSRPLAPCTPPSPL
jgi:sirohydrochlorin ferrochelatase